MLGGKSNDAGKPSKFATSRGVKYRNVPDVVSLPFQSSPKVRSLGWRRASGPPAPALQLSTDVTDGTYSTDPVPLMNRP